MTAGTNDKMTTLAGRLTLRLAQRGPSQNITGFRRKFGWLEASDKVEEGGEGKCSLPNKERWVQHVREGPVPLKPK